MKTRHAASAFDGEGARRHGGRWNTPGRTAVYVSSSRALAALEVLAGVGSSGLLASYSIIGVSFEDGLVEALDPAALPVGWDARPPTGASQGIGDAWLMARSAPVLRVPSVVLPAEHNYLLNPLHPEYGALVIGPVEPFAFDPRLVEP